MTEGYAYSAENRLERPCTYMYTPFEGPALFRKFEASRRAMLEALKPAQAEISADFTQAAAKLARIPSFRGARGVFEAGTVSRADGEGPIDTLRVLESCVARGNVAALEQLIRKFEVTKKLHSSYSGWRRKGTGDDRDVEIYALFSLALALAIANGAGLKFLNTLMKVNDLLGSVVEAVRTRPRAAAAARLSVAFELACVTRLADEMGCAHAD